ncbi:MAG: tRNA (guanosine(46)-N7)-methyltransferase TrmB [Defluviitaleaceae bacterium]|nr:tRNA (guanosine(46)-N7)-methyltransferase TrmB [Defluviitaleaceae bacterium]
MRARKKKWAPAELENNPRIIRDLSSFEGKSLKDYFDNDHPVYVEIGCGKGRFITETSLRHPDINFVAIEREPMVLAAAARRAEAVNAGSLIFALEDVDNLLNYFKPGDISRLYINFCDPWPGKKKWAKRRLTHDNYLAKYEALGIPEIFFKTDNIVLFEASLESFSRMHWTLQNVSLDLHKSKMEDNIMTEYEEKFSPHGPIYRLEAMPPAVMRKQDTQA